MMIPKDGTIETVEQMIEVLKKCNPKARVSVHGAIITVNAFDKNNVYLDVCVK